jgi:hypothetical protein
MLRSVITGAGQGKAQGRDRQGMRFVLERVVFLGGPVIVLLLTVVASSRSGDFAIDFRTVTPEMRSIWSGANPYIVEGMAHGGRFIWPAITAVLLAPLAFTPHGDVVMTGLEIVCLLAALRVFGVSDWRIYGVAAMWPATVNSVQTANLTLPVLLLVALGWRDRDKARGGLWFGVAAAVKLFMWPILIWLIATRRFKQLGAAAIVLVVSLLVQAVVAPLWEFVDYTRLVERTFADEALSLYGLLYPADPTLARMATLAAGGVVLWFGRRNLGLCIAAALILSPIVWLHYFDLLVVPLALVAAPLALWCVPLLMVIVPGMGNGASWQTAAALVVGALTVLVASSRAPRGMRRSPQMAETLPESGRRLGSGRAP